MGTIIWYAASTPPTGWLVCNGQSTSSYPALAAVVGSYVPDLRGEFIRGMDLGRGIDSGRTLGSFQGDTIRNITGSIIIPRTDGNRLSVIGTSGAFSQTDIAAGYSLEENNNSYTRTQINFNASTQVPTANENRPRNVALLPCIKY